MKKLILEARLSAETELDEDITDEELREEKDRVLMAFFGDEGIFSGEAADWLSEPEFTVVEG